MGTVIKQKVLISVDTEGPAGQLPVERMIYGKIRNGKEYGINFLMDYFDREGVRALFFVDIPEMNDHGEEKISKVMLDIASRGHDVGVHVHPDHMADPQRWYLWQYSYDEQYEILSRCTEFYEKTLKKAPLSFRAGRYGANNDTLEVLKKLGYQYDMSQFYASRYCLIQPPITWNRVVRNGDSQLKEVPVTTVKSFSTSFYERNDQIDSGRIPGEFRRFMKEILRTGSVDVVSMFFHSFQFINWRMDPDNPRFSKKKYNYVISNMKYLKEQGVEFITENDLAGIAEHPDDKLGPVDVSKGLVAYWYFFVRAASVLRDRMVRNV